MITPDRHRSQPVPRWQRALATAIRDPAELLARLDLDPGLLPAARRAAALFPLRVPESYLARIRPGNPDDPLLRQVLPLGEELQQVPGYVSDPVGDLASRQGPGLLKKYRGRALLITTGACAIHCRYCFRRHFPYAAENAGRERWRPALEAVAADPDIHEVILSGGDPLSLGDRSLSELLAGLSAIAHVRRLRFHTRLPVVLPERVTPELCRLIRDSRLPVTVVVHANHANELDADVGRALQALRVAGALLFNQSVLLRGVNDSVQAMATLGTALADFGVAPYYLHLLDPVSGAAHFEVPESEAVALIEKLREQMPGYMIPRLVREVPGEAAKRPLYPMPRLESPRKFRYKGQ
jgi:EF-P beta-lysylation protein EpmB